MNRRVFRRLPPATGLMLALLLPSLGALSGAAGAQVGEPRRAEILPPPRVRASPPPPRGVAGDLSARPRQESVIPAAGPSPNALRPERAAAADTALRPAAARVYDRGGRLIPGALQVGPNRVVDPRTGRHLEVRARGDDLQVVPGG
ncbi:hypothetical protein QFW77_17740 [Luteimonas sp. RD2P54]|uniref:Secreted protein n=1 Tax=Luteimonas endophytica TaxID=3042023 RepID=A0ABT6JDC4_9GAMM|nr:hypothetical protein [Luteimonas endophytica]MDH5824815.1 hypothetical protein [Luteimonas endophytica]